MASKFTSLLILLAFCYACPEREPKTKVYIDCLIETPVDECLEPVKELCNDYSIISIKESATIIDSEKPILVNTKIIKIDCYEPKITRKMYE
jgi:hypothetical protein